MAFIFNPWLQLKGQTFVCFFVSFLSCLQLEPCQFLFIPGRIQEILHALKKL